MLKGLFALAALALLGACNMVVTKDPVFSKADVADAPAMRPGVWDGDPPAGCQVDENKSLAEWPACASGFVVQDDHTFGAFKDENGKRSWMTTDYLLASGQPRVLQVHVTAGTNDPVMPSMYLYAGFEATKFDDQGRIVAGRTWIVVCGPPPPANDQGSGSAGAGAKPHLGTLHPFAGLTMDGDGVNCTPGSPAALRNAAGQSRALTAPKDISGPHWVRDGDK